MPSFLNAAPVASTTLMIESSIYAIKAVLLLADAELPVLGPLRIPPDGGGTSTDVLLWGAALTAEGILYDEISYNRNSVMSFDLASDSPAAALQ
jgi:hypothetical protein